MHETERYGDVYAGEKINAWCEQKWNIYRIVFEETEMTLCGSCG